MKASLYIIKIGGQLIESPERLRLALHQFHALEGAKILVHGGGKRASQLLPQLGISPKMHLGRRVTDEATLEVVTMVYAGLINKNIVAQLQALGGSAAGLCGADFNSIRAHKRILQDYDYGFAGDIDEVNTQAIDQLLSMGVSPVFCAITHDCQGQLLNTNADTIAAQLGIAMAGQYEVRLKFCFEMQGVLENPEQPDSVIRQLDRHSYEAHKASGVISDGMIPKIDNAMAAQRQGVEQVHICSIEGIASGGGTRILYHQEKAPL